jgi:hypothetical protein
MTSQGHDADVSVAVMGFSFCAMFRIRSDPVDFLRLGVQMPINLLRIRMLAL